MLKLHTTIEDRKIIGMGVGMQARLSEGIIEILTIKEAAHRIKQPDVSGQDEAGRAWGRMMKEQGRCPRIEMLPGGVVGELFWKEQGEGNRIIPFFFLLTGEGIQIAANDMDCIPLESRLSPLILEEGMVPGRFLIRLLDGIIKDDMLFLQNLETVCYQFEENLQGGQLAVNPFILMSESRKGLRERSFLYQQLLEAVDTMAENPCDFFTESEVQSIQHFGSKVERLNQYGKVIREYIVQLREMYQQSLDEQQNRTMQLLTVVTTVFLPLTLIAGWYGMNFVNMPELHSPYGYTVIVITCLLIVIGEIIYFKHKNFF